ncbi:MAG TPA: hypothetical protein VL294_03530 [Pseudolysinimonas sp.]|nr:hypothetical protein [Pseudolysinimonas sp.]
MAEVDPRFDPAFQRGYRDLADDAGELDQPPQRGIRYRLVLLVASVVAIVAGAALVWYRLAADPLDVDYGSDPVQLFGVQLVDSLVLPLLMAGLVGVILWLALGALRDRDDA